MKRGLAWSAAGAVVLRMGTLLIGIALARILAPADFGVYAIGLTVQSVLLTLADLGMGADLVRSKDFPRRAPTVTTISVGSSLLLCLGMIVTAGPAASALGSPSAAPVIVVLSFTLVIAAAGVSPYAKLMRDFDQKKLFVSGCIDFVLSSVVTLLLVFAGTGPIALAIGRLVAQVGATVAQFVFARLRPRFGFDITVARSALVFGIPLAAGNLLSWALLSVDKVAVGHLMGEVSLGLYVLAFNVASWPMTAIGQAIRSVSLPAFAHRRIEQELNLDPTTLTPRDRGPAVGLGYAWVVALPAGALLAALSVPLVRFLYGDRWLPAAAVLGFLGLFGALRVLFDVSATYLLAVGASRAVLWAQIAWIVALVPAMVVGTRMAGGVGAGWAHLGVSLLVVVPIYAWFLWRAQADLRLIGSVLWVPLLAAVPVFAVARLIASTVASPWLALILGGLAGLAVYALAVVRWLPTLSRLRQSLTRDPSALPGVVIDPGLATPAGLEKP